MKVIIQNKLDSIQSTLEPIPPYRVKCSICGWVEMILEL